MRHFVDVAINLVTCPRLKAKLNRSKLSGTLLDFRNLFTFSFKGERRFYGQKEKKQCYKNKEFKSTLIKVFYWIVLPTFYLRYKNSEK